MPSYRRCRTLLLLLAAGVAQPAFARSALDAATDPRIGEGPVYLRDILGGLRELPTRWAPPAGPGRDGALDGILGQRSYPGTCATPLVLALTQALPGLPERARALVDRLGPETARHEAVLTPAPDPFPGSFRIRYTVAADAEDALRPDDADLDGVPDEARRLLGLLQEARGAILGIFELSDTAVGRPDAAEPVHDVEVTRLPPGLGGWVWTGPRGPVLLLDREAALGPGGPALLRHQFAHLLQVSLSRDESPWWYEAHAIWAENPAGTGAGVRARAVEAYLASGRIGFEPDLVSAWEGAFLWPHYLLASGGPTRTLGRIWEEMAEVPGNNTLAALNRAVEALRGSTLADEVRAFRLWNLFLGEFDDGAHYAFGEELPTPPFTPLRSHPAALSGSAALPPLSGETLQVVAEAGRGGWLLEFQGDDRAEWDVALVTVPAPISQSPALAELEIRDRSRGSAAIPWRDLAALFVVVQNLAGGPGDPAPYALSARHDPLVPFDLMSFSAETEAGGVALRWETEQEVDLLGWRIHRSRDPVAGFEPLNDLLIPAAGGPASTAYVFVDSGARPGRKYYYVLEGVTRLGFTEISHTAAVRIPPGAPDRRRD